MIEYGSLCDDYYCNLHLHTEMDLPQNRETVLHFFEQMQRKYPTLRNFFNREKEIVLEEDKDQDGHRWVSIEPRRLAAGQINPQSLVDTLKMFDHVLELAPFELGVSSLDCESLNIMHGFDFTYRGNHSRLLADVLGVNPALDKFSTIPGATILGCDPMIQLALDDQCRVQLRVNIESRTTAFAVRTREFPEEQLSVYLTVRRYGGLDPGESFVTAARDLAERSFELIDEYLLEHVIRPLQQAIAID